MIDKLKVLQDRLVMILHEQLDDLCEVDAKELGEVVDVIKDIEEAEYYSSAANYYKMLYEKRETEKTK